MNLEFFLRERHGVREEDRDRENMYSKLKTIEV